jgi:hypothetical protein
MLSKSFGEVKNQLSYPYEYGYKKRPVSAKATVDRPKFNVVER